MEYKNRIDSAYIGLGIVGYAIHWQLGLLIFGLYLFGTSLDLWLTYRRKRT